MSAKLYKICLILVTILLINQISCYPRQGEEVETLISKLMSNEPSVRISAAMTLGDKSQEEVYNAVPALIETLKDRNPEVRVAAIEALGKIKPELDVLLPCLTDILSDENYNVMIAGAKIIKEYGPDAKSIVPVLIEGLKHSSGDVRYHYSLALGWIGENSINAIPHLLILLDDKLACVRSAAISSLSRIKQSQEVINCIIKMLEDEDEWVRYSAAAAIGYIGVKANLAVPNLIDLLDDGSEKVRIQAASALYFLAAKAKQAVPALLEAYNNYESPINRSMIILALGRIGPEPGVVETIIGSLESEDERILRSGVEALGEVGAEPRVVENLVNMLGNKFPEVRIEALEALSKIDLEMAVIKVLIISLNDNNPDVQVKAATVLGKLGSTAKIAIPELIRALDDEELKVSVNAAHALGLIGPDAMPALEHLKKIAGFDDTNRNVGDDGFLQTGFISGVDCDDAAFKVEAAFAVAMMSKDNEEAISLLIEAVDNKFCDLAYRAISAIALIGPGLGVVDTLIKALENDSYRVRRISAETLGRMGSAAVSALPKLRELANHPFSPRFFYYGEDEDYRIAAQEAILKIDAEFAEEKT